MSGGIFSGLAEGLFHQDYTASSHFDAPLLLHTHSSRENACLKRHSQNCERHRLKTKIKALTQKGHTKQ